jgi:hypothetical protein
MSEPETIPVEGEWVKQFRVYWCDVDNRPYECEGEYDTIAEVRAHRFRPDRRYKIRVGATFMTRPEFEEWAKNQA